MSPILVRPVREQFEHDRVIRVLQARYKRKYEVAINPGAEQNASIGIGDIAMYPDLVLFSQERSRKLQGTVEVETTESINTLEAMAEWGPFSRLRTPFFLYVPANSIDTVRRLCTEHQIAPAEIWTYHTAIDQLRFVMVHRSPDAPREPRDRPEKPEKSEALPTPVATPAAGKPAAPVKAASPARAVPSKAPAAKPVAKAAPVKVAARNAAPKKGAKTAKDAAKQNGGKKAGSARTGTARTAAKKPAAKRAAAKRRR